MSGNLVNLSQPGIAIPDPVVVDSNVVIAFFQAFFPGEHAQQVDRASSFFRRLRAENQQAILTPSAFSELLHVAVRNRYKLIVKDQRRVLTARYGVPINTWVDLYKEDPTILQDIGHNLAALRQALVARNIVIAGAEDMRFARYPSARPYAEELIDRMVRYGLDSSDTCILLEAERLGVTSVVTMDRDIRRALSDFDIYTWT
ncbi:MAG: type II toxin-antitoxin system VapC family toxin [Thermomicrobiales bacterium]